jgi:hypothetical protein
MKTYRYERLRPDIETQWGNFENPYFLYDPDEYKFRQPAPPWLVRGRSPRQEPPPYNPLGIFGDTDTASLIKMVLIIGAVGLVAWLAYSAGKGARKNPPRARRSAG